MKIKFVCITLLIGALAFAGCGKKEEPAAEGGGAAAPSGPVAAVDPATAGTIVGKVAFTGKKPESKPIRMDAEPSCKQKHSGPVHSDEVVVNDNGTLEYAFVYIKDGLGDRNFEAPKNPITLDQDGCVYKPHVVGVQTNQELKIMNSDPTTHNIHPLPKNNREWNESQAPNGAPLSKTFAREEILIPVKCNVHPWMKSYIGVVRHPYYAVTGKEGTFELKNVPPGEYTVTLWHEKFGTQDQKVTVGAKETKTVEFTVSGAGTAAGATH